MESITVKLYNCLSRLKGKRDYLHLVCPSSCTDERRAVDSQTPNSEFGSGGHIHLNSLERSLKTYKLSGLEGMSGTDQCSGFLPFKAANEIVP